jgi:predicted  nucleic acid-binding Zn-ribbon protein
VEKSGKVQAISAVVVVVVVGHYCGGCFFVMQRMSTGKVESTGWDVK